jgi:hypothetical protein
MDFGDIGCGNQTELTQKGPVAFVNIVMSHQLT